MLYKFCYLYNWSGCLNKMQYFLLAWAPVLYWTLIVFVVLSGPFYLWFMIYVMVYSTCDFTFSVPFHLFCPVSPIAAYFTYVLFHALWRILLVSCFTHCGLFHLYLVSLFVVYFTCILFHVLWRISLVSCFTHCGLFYLYLVSRIVAYFTCILFHTLWRISLVSCVTHCGVFHLLWSISPVYTYSFDYTYFTCSSLIHLFMPNSLVLAYYKYFGLFCLWWPVSLLNFRVKRW